MGNGKDLRFTNKHGWIGHAHVSIVHLEKEKETLLFLKDTTIETKSAQFSQDISKIQADFAFSKNKRELFDNILSMMLDIMQSAYGFIGEVLYKEDGSPYLKTYAITNIAWTEDLNKFYHDNAPKGLEFGNMETLFGRVITSKEFLISNNPYGDKRRGGLPEGHPHM